jgi:hypothetical protein
MSKASVLTIRVPTDLKSRIEVAADKQGVSINQLAMYMFTREVSGLEAGEKIAARWRGYTREQLEAGFDAAMAKVKKRRVSRWDRSTP